MLRNAGFTSHRIHTVKLEQAAGTDDRTVFFQVAPPQHPRHPSPRPQATAEAARPFLGQAGFALIAIAAILSTASAINATLYGAARVSYSIARDGELPAMLERKVWSRPVGGLFITAELTLFVANAFDLTSISTLGSAGFLLIFAAVNTANARHRRHTHSRGWISVTGATACVAAFGALVWQTARTGPGRLWVLAAMVALAVLIEGSFRLAKREIRLHE